MKEIITAGILVALLLVIANPFHVWMPSMMVMLILVCLFAAFSVFAVFMLREHPRDEREALHRMLAGRVGFLSGAGVLTVAIIVEELQETLDIWLVIALVVMIVAKMGARMYSDRNH